MHIASPNWDTGFLGARDYRFRSQRRLGFSMFSLGWKALKSGLGIETTLV